jgi:hypothetical protein
VLPVFLPAALAAALSAAPAAPAAPAAKPDPLDAKREAVANEILRVGVELKRAIAAGDPAPLLARVPEGGLRCAGRVVPKARVAGDLANPRSWLHGVFFGGSGFAPPAGTATSLRALLRDAPELQGLVAFRRDERAGALGRPCLDFRARDLATPGAPLCFEARGGRWWLTESLYPCG